MWVHRATTSCPLCSTQEEVWYYNSNIAPISFIECTKCKTVFEADQYINNLLDLYQNVTVSVADVVNNTTR